MTFGFVLSLFLLPLVWLFVLVGSPLCILFHSITELQNWVQLPNRECLKMLSGHRRTPWVINVCGTVHIFPFISFFHSESVLFIVSALVIYLTLTDCEIPTFVFGESKIE